jgi:hypothetical protein
MLGEVLGLFAKKGCGAYHYLAIWISSFDIRMKHLYYMGPNEVVIFGNSSYTLVGT